MLQRFIKVSTFRYTQILSPHSREEAYTVVICGSQNLADEVRASPKLLRVGIRVHEVDDFYDFEVSLVVGISLH